MLSNIVYAYVKKGVMLDRLDMTLLLNSESLRKTSDGSKSFKNSMSEVLPGRMLLGRRIKGLIRNDSFLLVMEFLVKVLHEHDKEYNHDACDYK